MWPFLAPFRNREPRLTVPPMKKEKRRRRLAFFRPRLEWLEERINPDVGDTMQLAVNTHVGPSVGSYTMLSEHLGDGPYGAADVDMYSLKAKAGQVLTATTSPAVGGISMDTYLRLFDSNGNELASNDDSNGSYSRIENYVFGAAGTYYVGVSGYPNSSYNPAVGGSGNGGSNGDYRLDVNLFVPTADAAGDTLATAQATGLGPTPGTFGVDATIGDGLYLNNDVDLYQFNANAGQLITAVTSQPSGGTPMYTVLRLFDANGNELINNAFGNGTYSRFQYQVASAGSYYIGVSGYYNYYYNPTVANSGFNNSLGDYHLDLTVATPVADAAGDTLAAAQATNLGPTPGTFSATAKIGDGLYPLKDVDLYQINANAGQLLTAITSLPTGGTPINAITMRLFDAGGHQLAIYYYGYNSSSRIDYQFTGGGAYYIGLSGYPDTNYDPNTGGSGTPYSTPATGDYQLSLTLATPVADAAGDSIATAQATNLGPADGSFSATAHIGDGLYPFKDVDLYQVQANAGQLLTAITSLPAGGTAINNITLRLFNASGTELASYYYGYNSSSRIDYQFAAAGTYYVGISGFPNTNYNPNVAGSGTPYYTPATGDYQIGLTLVTPTPDAAGDTIATAQASNLGPADGSYSVTARIGDGLYPLRDVDLYQFQAAAGQVVTAQTARPTGGTYMTPILRLFDASGHQLGNIVYSYGYRLEYQFSTAGTYYLGVSGSNDYNYDPNTAGTGFNGSRGDYQLSLALATPTADAAGDTLATAQVTALGPANGTFSVTARIGDGLYPLRDVDLYQFQATAGQGLIAATSQVTGGTFLNPTLRLFDATGHQLMANPFGTYPNALIRYVFASSGTYYLGVSGSGNGSYDPTTAGSGAPVGGRGDYHLDLSLVTPNLDSVGDSISTALATGLGPTAGTYTMPSAHIGDGFWGLADVDMYGFSATAGQRLTITASGVGSTPAYYEILRLFDASGRPLAFTYNYTSSVLQNFTIPATGTYYLGVSGYYNANYDPNTAGSGSPAYTFYTGDYRLDMTLVTPAPDAEGDTIATAMATGLGPTAGTYSHTAHIGDGLYPQDDVDLYRIDVNAGQFLRVMTSQPAGGQFLNPVLRLFDAAGHELALNYSYYSANTTIEYQFTTAGAYYIGVSGNYNLYYNPNVANSGYLYQSTGDYHLDMTLITPTPDAEGDTLATALATALGPTDGSYSHTAKIGDGLYFSKDVDLYQINGVAGQVISVQTSVPTGGTPFDAYLRLFDASGNELSNGVDVLEYRLTTTGTFYIGISGYYNFNYDPNTGGSGTPYTTPETGDYQLNLTLLTPTPDLVGDTIATALDTRLGPNAGTYTLPNTRIGDGLYVSRDVDMYQFRVQAGQVLTATTVLPSGGTPVDTVLTLFDASGNILAQTGSMTGNSDSQLQYTFPTKGTYYLGVSGGPNYYYDPNTAGSGYLGGHGDYTLILGLDKLVKSPVGGGGQHVQQVTGHAVWHHDVGLPGGGQHIDQVSINAWLDAAGTAHGTMTWTTVDHQLGDNGGNGQSKGNPYAMRVDTLIIIGNTVHVEGVVVRSGQSPGAIGSRVSWDIVDNGNGGDLLNGEVTDGGNFTIH
jgi:hypothetical protein